MGFFSGLNSVIDHINPITSFGNSKLGSGIGSGIGSVGKGIGKGASAIGSGIGSLTKGLGDLMNSPILLIGGVAVLAFVVMKK